MEAQICDLLGFPYLMLNQIFLNFHFGELYTIHIVAIHYTAAFFLCCDILLHP